MSVRENDVFVSLEQSWRRLCAFAFLVLWQMFGIFPFGRLSVFIYPLLNCLAAAVLLYFTVGLFHRGLSIWRRLVRGVIVVTTLFLLSLVFVPRFAGVWALLEHEKTTLIRPVAGIFRFGKAQPQLVFPRDCSAYYRCTLIFNPSDNDPCDSKLLESADFARESDLSDFVLAAPMPTVAIADHYCSAIYKSKYIPWFDAPS
jgi:hypothetical protein